MAVLTPPRTQTRSLSVLDNGGRPTSGVETLEVISPELALVDPELATRARASLRTYGDKLVDAEQPALYANETAPETVLSPELALVDPVLAAWARTQLPDLSHVAPVVREQQAPGPSPEVVQADDSPPPLGSQAEEPLSPGRDGAGEVAERPVTLERRRARHMRSLGRATLAAAAVVLVAAGVVAGDVIRQQGRTLPAAFNFTVQTAANAPPARSAPHATDSAKRQPSSTSVGSTRGFGWVPVAATSAYEVEFYRAGRRIFSARTTHAKLTVAKSWTYRGRRERFTPGTYRWYVWPIYKSGSGGRGTPLVNSVLVVRG